MKKWTFVLSAVALAAWQVPAHAQNFSADELTRRHIERRAVEAVIWGMSAVNTDLMRQEMLTKTNGKVNQFIYWGRPLDWRNQTLTPNPDTLYFMAFFNTKDVGPLVLEVPPGDANGSLNGNIVTTWQTSLEDVGLLGLDKGVGGKFLILPPDYAKAVPDGYFVYRSGTNNVFVFLRSFYQDPDDLAPAVAVMEGTKIYPLGRESDSKPMQYPDASGVPANMLPLSDGDAFEQLKMLVDSEGTNLADPDWRGMLAAIGIIKGEPFNPDQQARAILDRAAKTAYKTSRVVGFEDVVAGRNFRVYPDRRWVNPIADGTPSNAAPWICPGARWRADNSIWTPASGSSPTITRSALG